MAWARVHERTWSLSALRILWCWRLLGARGSAVLSMGWKEGVRDASRPRNGRSTQAPLCTEYLGEVEECWRNSERHWPQASPEALTTDSYATRDQQPAKLGTQDEFLMCKAAKAQQASKFETPKRDGLRMVAQRDGCPWRRERGGVRRRWVIG